METYQPQHHISIARQLNNDEMILRAKKSFELCQTKKGNVSIIDDGKTICLYGEINQDMFITLMKNEEKIHDRPLVVITSPGGRIDSAIDIADTLNKYDPTPIVGGMCASACAQFLFLMGKRRVLLHCGVVAIHGGPVPIKESLALPLDNNAAHQKNIEDTLQFINFYKSKNISLTMVNDPPESIRRLINKGELVFWQWSINQMRGFGVKGIISHNNPRLRSPADYDAVCKD